MDAAEIYIHLQQIIENVNSFIADLIQGDYLKKESELLDKRERKLSNVSGASGDGKDSS